MGAQIAQTADVDDSDEIRPDWEAKLNAVKAAAARKASRRIVMRQVGDRLIPIGYTSARAPGTADFSMSVGTDENGSRRRRNGSGRERDLEEVNCSARGSGVCGSTADPPAHDHGSHALVHDRPRRTPAQARRACSWIQGQPARIRHRNANQRRIQFVRRRRHVVFPPSSRNRGFQCQPLHQGQSDFKAL